MSKRTQSGTSRSQNRERNSQGRFASDRMSRPNSRNGTRGNNEEQNDRDYGSRRSRSGLSEMNSREQFGTTKRGRSSGYGRSQNSNEYEQGQNSEYNEYRKTARNNNSSGKRTISGIISKLGKEIQMAVKTKSATRRSSSAGTRSKSASKSVTKARTSRSGRDNAGSTRTTRTSRPSTKKGTSRRGFASMSAKEQKEIASMGGRAAHKQGVAHQWTSREARIAGRKGGLASGKARAKKKK